MKVVKKPILLFAVILLFPLLLFKSEADAANDSLPFYNDGAVELRAPLLPEGQSTLYGRADHTIGINPILGQMRYPTMYDGRIGGSSYAAGLNSSFSDPWVGVINRAHQGQPYYHLVPVPGRDSARNVIEVSKVSESIMKDVYNGNPEYMSDMLDKHEIQNADTGVIYDELYYIVEIAHYAGGVADNANASDSFNGVNPTWLRFVRTSWPDITEFKASSSSVEVGDSVDFSFTGYEYVSESRNAVSATLTIKKDGVEVAKEDLSFSSNKSEKNQNKPAEEHAGKFEQSNASSWSPEECGSYTVELKVEDSVKRYADKTISIEVDGDCDDDPTPSPGLTCSIDINISESGDMQNTEDHMKADPNGSITESHESNIFDVLQYGIPSSEYLKVYGLSEKYLTEYLYRNMTGSITYTINVKKQYHLKWQDEYEVETEVWDEEEEEWVTETTYEYEDREAFEEREIDFQDPYTVGYWQIGHLNVYSFMDAAFKNYALPNEQVIVANSQLATANSIHSSLVLDHVFLKDCNNVDLGTEVIDGGLSRPSVPDESALFEEEAELTSRTPDVKNDLAEVDGFLSMDDTLVSGMPGNTHVETPAALEVPLAEQVEVERSSLLIDPTKVNKWETDSSITARYESIHVVNVPKGTKEFTGYSPEKINTVTVHTPVVMYARASDDKEHDQRTKPPERSTPADPDNDRHAFILDRPFTVTLPTNGQHLDVGMAPGYGDRDYAKYFREKEIKFPFDVYTETQQGFYPKDTWIKVPIDTETVTFFMPVWVPEDEYTIKYRSVAINAPDVLHEEHHANLNMSYRTPNEVMENHVAYDTIEVDVVGRLYDFRVTDILDFQWHSAFRTTQGMPQHNGNYYWVGDKTIDGDVRGNKMPFMLPVRQGSHPNGYPNLLKNVAVKPGYQFKFDLKTKGNMFDSTDAIRITPSFYFVDKKGKKRMPVDVYYHSDDNYFVKIGSKEDKEYRKITLNEPLRNVNEKQLYDTAEYLYRHPQERYKDLVTKMTKETFIKNFIRKYSKDAQVTGSYDWQILNRNLRTLIGPDKDSVPPSTMVPDEDVKAREQMWYGEYSLPADIYVVEPGRDISGYGQKHRLNKNSPIFLRDGYVIVNFNIETIDNGDLENPRLQYHQGPLNNQWKMEGFKYNFIDPYGFQFDLLDGDVIFYHGDRSSYEDFKANVTH